MAASAPLPVQFKKMYKAPINPDSVFASLSDAEAYASGPTGSPGEIIGVKIDEAGNYKAYIINTDGSISAVGEAASFEDLLVWRDLP